MSKNKVNEPGDDVHYHEFFFPRTLHESDGSSKFVEDRETSVLEETRCGAKERDQKLLGHRLDIMYYLLFVWNKKRAKELEAITRGRN